MEYTLWFELPDHAATQRFGERLATVLRAGDLVVLSGDLGAGKTTLTQGLGAGLGVRGPITSPTFIVAREHPSLVGGPPLVHVDAYRLGSFDELDALDLDATMEEAVTVVEWGQGLVESLTMDRLDITVQRPRGDASDTAGRQARITMIGSRWDPVHQTMAAWAGALQEPASEQ